MGFAELNPPEPIDSHQSNTTQADVAFPFDVEKDAPLVKFLSLQNLFTLAMTAPPCQRVAMCSLLEARSLVAFEPYLRLLCQHFNIHTLKTKRERLNVICSLAGPQV